MTGASKEGYELQREEYYVFYKEGTFERAWSSVAGDFAAKGTYVRDHRVDSYDLAVFRLAYTSGHIDMRDNCGANQLNTAS
ncbi:hypothetical protein FKX85_19055 [Echinicola soli]|uniref:Uncharacterized protein n=1 Tax=Echinicola soli TaxID=2591634 RepID=A0A514CMK5_9BACT|nr:hypothetical protein [Echinicola soli]QDH81028.1 hypothetical protein FKX85_19055 [Echinicola soli]